MSDERDAPIDELAQEQNETSDAELRDATLAGMPGLGVLQVVRGGGGGIASIDGTWRPREGEGGDLAGLERARASGETVRYRGTLHDPGRRIAEAPHDVGQEAPQTTTVDVEVRITSVQSYRMNELEDGPGPERTFVNFNLAGELPPEIER